jgi:taurine dioxygenase
VTTWRRLIGSLGAERSGLELSRTDPRELLDDLYRYQLLVVRNLRLDPEGLTRFASRLGELDRYPFAEPLPEAPYVVRVVKEAEDETNFGGAWHSDTAYLAEPPAITVLYAVETPATGGDTLFADMYGAFERLSAGFQSALRRLSGHNTAALVHDSSGGYHHVAGQSVPARATDEVTEADHPLVIRHPWTARPALYFSLIHTERFTGMTRAESLPLLEQLHTLATAPENVTRLRWAPGTLAIWDNRSVLHYPLNDYPGERREMHRVIVRGDRPRRAA